MYESEILKQSSVTVARRLLGSELCTTVNGVVTGGLITECEAYSASGDPACHTARGMTKRNASMFKAGGHVYVYLIYGIYYCVNIVTGLEGEGAAVLIRGLIPTVGKGEMESRLKKAISHEISGPGLLCISLGITKAFDGVPLGEKILLKLNNPVKESLIESTPRIGISRGKDLLWRFKINPSKT
jgi:DNA-3-methyladenine glycosylase